MALKNRTSHSTATFQKIQDVLALHGASKIMFDYDNGIATCISFQIIIDNNPVSFRLPALIENVTQIMYGGRFRGRKKNGNILVITDSQREQAFKTGWANIRDWIDAQMALIETKQVQLFQVFLPYAVTSTGETIYEKVASNPNLLLNSKN